MFLKYDNKFEKSIQAKKYVNDSVIVGMPDIEAAIPNNFNEEEIEEHGNCFDSQFEE